MERLLNDNIILEEVRERQMRFEQSLRPDVTKLPQGEELADLLEDIHRSQHGLEPMHGKSPTYFRELREYRRINPQITEIKKSP